MPVRLRVIPSTRSSVGDGRGPTAERSVDFSDDVAEIRIGRRPDLELPLPFTILSGVHARLIRGQGPGERGWFLEDLGSRNGTFLAGARMPPGEKRPIERGAPFALAHVEMVFEGPAATVSGAEGTGTIARRLVADLFAPGAEASSPTVVVVSGAPHRSVLRLEDRDRSYVIGRVESCDLRLAVEEISREHAGLTRKWNGVFVSDLGSKNGVRVNGVLAASQRVRDGDLIQIGPVSLRLFDPEDRYLRDFEARSGAASPAAPPPAAAAAASDGDGGGSERFSSQLHPAVAGALAADVAARARPAERTGFRAAAPSGARLATWIAAVVLAALAALAVLAFG